ncbi:arsinothricin biosynthesis radical SAM protein ArsL [Dactylosporangium sp. CA-092794]|uniref:arsinothricin biosynthesis radical SAM protein ArsL n=1 Tax=Dactylosporangium sp. CA-092794 TaxID=3239929 RepID=UPI003D8DDBC3
MSDERVLIVSSFEAELQPLAAASCAAAMRAAGARVSGWDAHLFPDRPPEGPFDLVLLSVQQFEGLQRGVDLSARLRAAYPGTPMVAFGQYAQLNSGHFLDLVDGVAFDEPERLAGDLCGVAAGSGDLAEVPALATRGRVNPRPARRRIDIPAPARELFPSIVHYPVHHGPFGLMGNIEISRGCHHKCTYCSVYGAYDGGVAPYELDGVLADAHQLADEGVRHFYFIDAEFFNSRTLGVAAIRRIAAEIPGSTFEFTTRVDHILDYPQILEELVSLGLRRVTSALEFPSDRILRIFDKGIDVADMRRAIAEAARIGFELNPTFIPFTPWVRYEELLTFEDFLIETGLARVVEPTALQTRLLLFKGSPLLGSPWLQDVATVDRGFHLDWTHPDRRVESLWQERRADAEGAGAVRCCVKC